MTFVSGLVGGLSSVGIELCTVFLLLVCSCFDCIGGGVECVLGHLPSEVSMVIPSEGFDNVMFSGGVVSNGAIPSVFSLVARWCVCGTKRICVRTVGVDDVWDICVGAYVTWSVVKLNI